MDANLLIKTLKLEEKHYPIFKNAVYEKLYNEGHYQSCIQVNPEDDFYFAQVIENGKCIVKLKTTEPIYLFNFVFDNKSLFGFDEKK